MGCKACVLLPVTRAVCIAYCFTWKAERSQDNRLRDNIMEMLLCPEFQMDHKIYMDDLSYMVHLIFIKYLVY